MLENAMVENAMELEPSEDTRCRYCRDLCCDAFVCRSLCGIIGVGLIVWLFVSLAVGFGPDAAVPGWSPVKLGLAVMASYFAIVMIICIVILLLLWAIAADGMFQRIFAQIVATIIHASRQPVRIPASHRV